MGEQNENIEIRTRIKELKDQIPKIDEKVDSLSKEFQERIEEIANDIFGLKDKLSDILLILDGIEIQDGKYKCLYCKYKADNKVWLNYHLAVAHGVEFKWYECPHCASLYGKKFKNLDLLIKHMEFKHNTIKEQMKCTFCNYEGKDIPSFHKHLANAHK